jgi:hypothetical protein
LAICVQQLSEETNFPNSKQGVKMNYIDYVNAYTKVVVTISDAEALITLKKIEGLDLESRTAIEKQELALMTTDARYLQLIGLHNTLKAMKSTLYIIIENFKDCKDEVEKLDDTYFAGIDVMCKDVLE